MNRSTPVLLLSSLVLAAIAASTAGAQPRSAGGLAIGPTRISLSSEQKTQALTVTNERDIAILVQARTLLWEPRPAGEDYEATTDLIVSPPVFEIPAGGEQIVRVGLRGAAPSGVESTYRLILSEVPRAAELGLGVRFAIQFDLPVFVRPEADLDHRVDWSLRPNSKQGLTLRAVNRGNGHVQVRAIRLIDDAGKELTIDQPGYVLPGGEFSWHLENTEALAWTTGLVLQAETDVGSLTAHVGVNATVSEPAATSP